VHCILIGLAPLLASRNDRRLPMQIHRRYLVCGSGGDDATRVAWLETMMFRALDSNEPRLEAETPPIELWQSLGLPPQAGFVLCVPVTHQRSIEHARPVRTVDVQVSATGTLRGQVFDNRGVPLSKCIVEIPSRALRTSTGSDGAFGFAGVSRSSTHGIRVTWREKVFTARPEAGAGFSEPLSLTVDFSAQED
jgi:hypothetical protein